MQASCETHASTKESGAGSVASVEESLECCCNAKRKICLCCPFIFFKRRSALVEITTGRKQKMVQNITQNRKLLHISHSEKKSILNAIFVLMQGSK